jgi:nucleoside-diphosphate-sugar epimerase
LSREAVLVLGAGGFIGRRVVAALAASDWAQPIAASRHIDRVSLPAAAERVNVDATDARALAPLVAAAAGVVSCIAGADRDIEPCGRALLEVSAGLRAPPRVVYLSSMAAYGTSGGVVEENSPLRGDLGPYSAAKAAIDRAAAEFRFIVRLRPGIVYGPGSFWWSECIARLLAQRRLGDLGSAGAGQCNPVYVEDVAAAVLRSLQAPAAGGEAINLGSPDPVTWNEYFRAYARALRAEPVRHISAEALRREVRFYGPALKLAEIALGRRSPWRARPALRPWLLRLCRHDQRMLVGKAERILGMSWTPLDVGLSQTASWFLGGARLSR